VDYGGSSRVILEFNGSFGSHLIVCIQHVPCSDSFQCMLGVGEGGLNVELLI
jgi:hypothetical protein